MKITRTSSTSTDDIFITTDPPDEYYPNIYLSLANFNGPPAHERKMGMRFTNITIPQGSTIESVTLTFTVYSGSSTSITGRITGQLSDDSATFSSTADYRSRARTTNHYDWVIPSTVTDAECSIGPGTELKPIIQEIIDRGGWSSNNAITLFLEWYSGAADCGRSFHSFDNSLIKLPKLTISYTGGDYGIKIAKSGKSVTSENPEDYHFWSAYRSKSVKHLGSLQVTTTTDTDSAPVTNTYTHNFGYIPQFMVFVTSYDGGYVNCDYSSGGDYGKEGDLWEEALLVYATSTEIVVSANLYSFTPMSGTWTGLARTYTFDILLFMEEVETS